MCCQEQSPEEAHLGPVAPQVAQDGCQGHGRQLGAAVAHQPTHLLNLQSASAPLAGTGPSQPLPPGS